ncbi:MAG: sulfite exporter TauE/SafE family protein [Anaerolineales bacterium]|nr:sulfite exporter TauE/SafE family protein [Chloroflexota bacterium]MBL6983112.1 sulfite exporter TauE/SafE family protein [Anaerolineales bacterium]
MSYNPTMLKIALINFLATLSQTVAGFGAPLINMPFMIDWLGIHIATPVSSFVGLITSIIVLFYYREDFSLRSVSNLLIPSILGVPIGVYALSALDVGVVQIILGILVVGFALYSLFSPSIPTLKDYRWAYLFGFIAGITGGAFNISGPIIVIYAAFRGWPPGEFRSNLQGYFLVTNISILIFHWVDGNLTPIFWQASLWAIPGMLLAVIFGIYLGKWINVKRFRQLILVLLIVSGVRLII